MKHFNLVYIRKVGKIYKEPILCESKQEMFTYYDWLEVENNFHYNDEIQYMSSIYLGDFKDIRMAAAYLREINEELSFFILGGEMGVE